MSISNVLQNYAIESGLVAAEALLSGTGEEVALMDGEQTHLHDCIVNNHAATASMNNVLGEMNNLQGGVVSLEAAVIALGEMAKQNISLRGPAVASYLRAVTASMESRGIDPHLFKDGFDKLAYSAESTGKDDYCSEAEDKTKSVIARIVGMFTAAYNAVIQFFKDLYLTYGKSAAALAECGLKLKRIAPTVYGKPTRKLPGKKFKKLGTGSADVVKCLKAMLLAEHTVATLHGEVLAQLHTAGDAMRSGKADVVKTALETISSHIPHGRTITTGTGSDLEWFAGKGDTPIDKLKTCKFSTSPVKGKLPAAVEPLSSGGIKDLATELSNISSLMLKIVKDSNKTLSDLNQTNTSMQFLAKNLSGGKATADEVDNAVQLVGMANVQLKLLHSVMPTYTSLLGDVGKEAYAFGLASARCYVKPNEVEPTAA